MYHQKAIFKKSATVMVAALLAAPSASAEPGEPSSEEVRQLAEDAYVFGYPLVLIDVTRQVMTATAQAGDRKAPINQFAHVRRFPDPTFRDVVSPNADTLYSTAFLDLSKEPIILSVPDTLGRYYLMQLMDAWSNTFASLGKRTTGTEARHFAITGPGWRGKLPAKVSRVEAPTNTVWIVGRTQTNGPTDYAAVHAIQAGYRLTPLSAFGRSYVPPTDVPVDPSVDRDTPPADQVAKMAPAEFFHALMTRLQFDPAANADGEMLERLATIDLTSPELQDLVKEGVSAALARIGRETQHLEGSEARDGWMLSYEVGTYGTKYLLRAAVAVVGLGANLLDDAFYPMAFGDERERELSGKHRYVLHFAKDEIPPVNAFWSLTMYDEWHFFVENPLGRYAIGDRDALKFNKDGSLDLYLQHQSPGPDKESNWLPAPEGKMNPILRLYWPKESVLKKTWRPPGLVRVDQPSR